MKDPIVSIVMPTLNSAATVGRAVESVLRQTFVKWELLLMDGGSTDDTVSIVKNYLDERIKPFVEKDNGIYDAMNKGIKVAKGELLYFLGSDDWLLDETVLENIVGQTGNDDVIYGDVEADNLKEEWMGEWSLGAIEYNRCHQAIFYRREVFDLVGRYPENYCLAADHYINIRCLLDKRIKMRYTPVKVAHFSAGGFSYNYHDYAFDKDRDWVIVRHGIGVLPYKQTLRHCKAALACKPSLFRKIYIYLIAATVLLFKPKGR